MSNLNTDCLMEKPGITLVVHKLAQDKKSNVALLKWSVEMGDTGLCDTRYGWHEMTKRFKEGHEIKLPHTAQVETYQREATDEETGEVLTFDWFRIEL